MQSAALVGTDFLNGVEMRIIKDVGTITKIPEASILPEVNKIDIIDKSDEIDLAHLKNEKCRDEVSDIISNYKAEKIRDVGIELNIVKR